MCNQVSSSLLSNSFRRSVSCGPCPDSPGHGQNTPGLTRLQTGAFPWQTEMRRFAPIRAAELPAAPPFGSWESVAWPSWQQARRCTNWRRRPRKSTKLGQTKEAESIELGRCCVHARQHGCKHMSCVMKLESCSILMCYTGPNTDTPLS